jgi:hypothetical protein
MRNCRTLEAPDSVIALWQHERPGQGDVKATCSRCGREGFAYYSQSDIDAIGPSRFECVFRCDEEIPATA